LKDNGEITLIDFGAANEFVGARNWNNGR